MSGESNSVSQNPFVGLLDEDMEVDPMTVNIPPPPTASSKQPSDPPLPTIPPPKHLKPTQESLIELQTNLLKLNQKSTL